MCFNAFMFSLKYNTAQPNQPAHLELCSLLLAPWKPLQWDQGLLSRALVDQLQSRRVSFQPKKTHVLKVFGLFSRKFVVFKEPYFSSLSTQMFILQKNLANKCEREPLKLKGVQTTSTRDLPPMYTMLSERLLLSIGKVK